MSIEQVDRIDVIGTDRATGEVLLTISDHLDWSGPDHFTLLTKKIEAYVHFCESGQLVESRPDARGRAIRIDVVHKYEPDGAAISYLSQLAQSLAVRSIGFGYHGLPQGY